MGRRAKRLVVVPCHFIEAKTTGSDGTLSLAARNYLVPIDYVFEIPIGSVYSLITGLRKALEEHRAHIVELQRIMQAPPEITVRT